MSFDQQLSSQGGPRIVRWSAQRRTSSPPPKVNLSLRYFTWMAMLRRTGPHSVTVLVQQPEPGETHAQLQRCVKVSLTAIEGASRTVNL